MIKSEKFRYFSIKLYVVIYHGGDYNTHPIHMILWRTYDNQGKNAVFFCKKFMSAETLT